MVAVSEISSLVNTPRWQVVQVAVGSIRQERLSSSLAILFQRCTLQMHFLRRENLYIDHTAKYSSDHDFRESRKAFVSIPIDIQHDFELVACGGAPRRGND
jgi:hypothetical protein